MRNTGDLKVWTPLVLLASVVATASPVVVKEDPRNEGTLCEPGELVWFACPTKKGYDVALCSSADFPTGGGWIEYRSGHASDGVGHSAGVTRRLPANRADWRRDLRFYSRPKRGGGDFRVTSFFDSTSYELYERVDGRRREAGLELGSPYSGPGFDSTEANPCDGNFISSIRKLETVLLERAAPYTPPPVTAPKAAPACPLPDVPVPAEAHPLDVLLGRWVASCGDSDERVAFDFFRGSPGPPLSDLYFNVRGTQHLAGEDCEFGGRLTRVQAGRGFSSAAAAFACDGRDGGNDGTFVFRQRGCGIDLCSGDTPPASEKWFSAPTSASLQCCHLDRPGVFDSRAAAGGEGPRTIIIGGGGNTAEEGASALESLRVPSSLVLAEGHPRVVESATIKGLKPGFHVVVIGACTDDRVAAAVRDQFNAIKPGAAYLRQVTPEPGQLDHACPNLAAPR